MQKVAINWFRKDLRLHDNPSLDHLSKLSIPIINIFIWDEEENTEKPLGGATKVWLYHSLLDLNKQLENSNSIHCCGGSMNSYLWKRSSQPLLANLSN